MSQFTKKAIVETFLILLKEHSLDKITVKDIAEKCGMAYHDNQPFSDNHLRPCPMLENPEILQ